MRKQARKFLWRSADRRSSARSCPRRFTSEQRNRSSSKTYFCKQGQERMAYPKDYKYTKEHEWIQIKGNTGLVGITDHAQESLGDIVFVELPKNGAEMQAGKSFGTVESVKAVSELYAPVSGKV